MDLYAILGISSAAKPEDVDRAWKAAVRMYHPDLFANDPVRAKEGEEMLKTLNLARATLGDKSRRLAYDASRISRNMTGPLIYCPVCVPDFPIAIFREAWRCNGCGLGGLHSGARRFIGGTGPVAPSSVEWDERELERMRRYVTSK